MGTQASKKSIGCRYESWWSQAGSNRRPLACHASALPAELWPHMEAREVTLRGPVRQENRQKNHRRRRDGESIAHDFAEVAVAKQNHFWETIGNKPQPLDQQPDGSTI